jgi:hypothetical protein
MQTIQDLYDFYIRTNPSKGKQISAATLLTHICQALNASSAEQISQKFYHDIVKKLEAFHKQAADKMIQDKGILAEMIGRFGPTAGYETIFNQLLDDDDENLRQFTLYALEYRGVRQPEIIIPYIERFTETDNALMKKVAARLTGKILCSKKAEQIKPVIKNWIQTEKWEFMEAIHHALKSFLKKYKQAEFNKNCQLAIGWINSEMK